MTNELAVIFDMDGVLIDSVGLNWQAMNQVLGRYKVHIDDKDLPKYIGQSLRDQVTKLNLDYALKLNYSDFEAETTEIKSRLFSNITPKPGVIRLLQVLKENGIPTAVATSSSRSTTQKRLSKANILNFFNVIVTEDDVSSHKPDPEVYITTASMLKVNPDSCVVFEDAPAGIKAAKAADMKCIGVKTKIVPVIEMFEADLVVQTLEIVSIATILKLFELI